MKISLTILMLLLVVGIGVASSEELDNSNRALYEILVSQDQFLTPDATLELLKQFKGDSLAGDLVHFDSTDNCSYLMKYRSPEQLVFRGLQSISIRKYILDRLEKLEEYCFKYLRLYTKFLMRTIELELTHDEHDRLFEFRSKALKQFDYKPGHFNDFSQRIAAYYQSRRGRGANSKLACLFERKPLGCERKTLNACLKLALTLHKEATDMLSVWNKMRGKEKEGVEWLQLYVLCGAALNRPEFSGIGIGIGSES